MKFNELILIFGIIAILFFMAVIAYFIIPHKTANTVAPAATPASRVLGETVSDLILYTNAKHKIQFEYPKILFIALETEDALKLTEKDCRDSEDISCGAANSFFFRGELARDLPLEDWIKENLFKKSNFFPSPSGLGIEGIVDGGEYCYSRAKQEPVGVAGQQATSFTFSKDQLAEPGKCALNKSFNLLDPDVSEEIYFKHGSSIIRFELNYSKDSGLDKIFHQILTTAKAN